MSTEKNWFDPNTYVEMMKSADMTKMFEGAKVPGFDTEAVTEAQKKNVQAFVDANRVAAEGYQSLFKKQVEVMQSSITEMTEAMKDASTTPMSAESAEKRMEAAKSTVRKRRRRLHRPVRSCSQGKRRCFRNHPRPLHRRRNGNPRNHRSCDENRCLMTKRGCPNSERP